MCSNEIKARCLWRAALAEAQAAAVLGATQRKREAPTRGEIGASLRDRKPFRKVY